MHLQQPVILLGLLRVPLNLLNLNLLNGYVLVLSAEDTSLRVTCGVHGIAHYKLRVSGQLSIPLKLRISYSPRSVELIIATHNVCD